MAVVAVAVRHLRSHEAEVHRGSHRSQRMIGPHAPIQIHLITEQLLLTLVPSHHIAEVRRNQTLAVQSPPDLGNRPSRPDVLNEHGSAAPPCAPAPGAPRCGRPNAPGGRNRSDATFAVGPLAPPPAWASAAGTRPPRASPRPRRRAARPRENSLGG